MAALRPVPVLAMIIDLLDIDLADGKHWIDRVVDEMRAQRLAEVRAQNRAAWLRSAGPPF